MSRTRTRLPAASPALERAGGRWHELVPIAAGQDRPDALENGAGASGEAHRCTCGSLLARLVASGVELKCRRCKRIVVLPFVTARAR